MKPHRPIARSRDFIPFQIQEFISRNILLQNKLQSLAFVISHQGRWKNNAMKNDIILPDKMNQTTLGILPIIFPSSTLHMSIGSGLAALISLLKIFLGSRDIPDWRIKPNIQNLTLGIGQRNLDTPIQIPRHCSWLQALSEPGITLPQDIGLPVLPRIYERFYLPLHLIQWQKPIRSFLQNRRLATQHRMRIFQVHRIQSRAAILALIPVGIGVSALGASPHNVSIRQKLLCLFIIILLRGLLHKDPFIIKIQKEFLCRFMMNLVARPAKNIKRNPKFFKGMFYQFM